MKTKNIPSLFLTLSFLLILSCSKTEENTPIININSLVLTASSSDQLLVVNEEVDFVLTGDDGNTYTDQAVFYVSQAAISGSTFTFNEEGTFEVYASYGGINSNTLTYNVITASSDNTLIVSNAKVLRNQEMTFSLVDNQGDDISSTATFYVDGSAISGNTYSSGSVGIFEVYAEYDVAGTPTQTDQLSFEVYIPKRKVVLEDYTGAWCGYCPAVAAAAESAHDVTDDIAIVAIHETSFTFPDPMHFDEVQTLKDAFGVDGLPDARINRTTDWSDPYPTASIISMAGEDTNVAIAINSQLSGLDLTVSVKVISEVELAGSDKLVVYLLEEGIIYDQINYYDNDPTSPYYQLGNPIPNFVHNEVLRLSLTSVLGDNVSSTAALTEYTRSFTTSILPEYNTSNLHIVVMLVSEDNSARNAQFSDIGEDKNYE